MGVGVLLHIVSITRRVVGTQNTLWLGGVLQAKHTRFGGALLVQRDVLKFGLGEIGAGSRLDAPDKILGGDRFSGKDIAGEVGLIVMDNLAVGSGVDQTIGCWAIFVT